jgi:hypothetical protein
MANDQPLTSFLPCDPRLPPREPVEGLSFCGLLAAMGARLYLRRDSPALTNSLAPWGLTEVHPFVVEVDFQTPDRDKPVAEDAWISVTITHPAAGPPGSPEFLAAVRACLRRAMAHEVDESLLVEGRRVFDPHQF